MFAMTRAAACKLSTVMRCDQLGRLAAAHGASANVRTQESAELTMSACASLVPSRLGIGPRTLLAMRTRDINARRATRLSGTIHDSNA
jgi:hypothetical protein